MKVNLQVSSKKLTNVIAKTRRRVRDDLGSGTVSAGAPPASCRAADARNSTIMSRRHRSSRGRHDAQSTRFRCGSRSSSRRSPHVPTHRPDTGEDVMSDRLVAAPIHDVVAPRIVRSIGRRPEHRCSSSAERRADDRHIVRSACGRESDHVCGRRGHGRRQARMGGDPAC